ncbi:hypothetical protein QBC39DRAFT_395384 [Podospora conica]|nr:hypothetical protein QBC39DRAFT_395384 [Schizothecium conicum]
MSSPSSHVLYGKSSRPNAKGSRGSVTKILWYAVHPKMSSETEPQGPAPMLKMKLEHPVESAADHGRRVRQPQIAPKSDMAERYHKAGRAFWDKAINLPTPPGHGVVSEAEFEAMIEPQAPKSAGGHMHSDGKYTPASATEKQSPIFTRGRRDPRCQSDDEYLHITPPDSPRCICFDPSTCVYLERHCCRKVARVPLRQAVILLDIGTGIRPVVQVEILHSVVHLSPMLWAPNQEGPVW